MASYPLVGLPLQPLYCADLIQNLCGGTRRLRSEITTMVKGYHELHQGAPSSYKNSVKRALSDLKRRGAAQPVHEVKGMYYVFPLSGTAASTLPLSTNATNAVVPVPPNSTIRMIQPPLKKIGVDNGNGCVYVYYFPSMKRLAELQQKTNWQCKIGSSKGDPQDRVAAQLTSPTSFPEYPVIGLVMFTDFPGKLERVAHAILTMRLKKIVDAPGQEWFWTNPGELETLYEFVSPQQERSFDVASTPSPQSSTGLKRSRENETDDDDGEEEDADDEDDDDEEYDE